VGFAALVAASAPALAQVAVSGAWVRGTVAGQKVTGAFMQLTSPVDASLVDAATPAAKFVEIHEMKKEGEMMKMKAVDRVPLPAGKPVDLKPGGYHVMLFDLKAPLKEGDVVPLTLTIEDKAGKKSTVEVKAAVRALTASDPPPAKH
jgi:copper(I)-binding protein